MTSPQQQQEFEAAIQQHIQQAVAAAVAGMPPPVAPTPPTVNVNAVAVKLPEFCRRTRRPVSTKQRPPFAVQTSPHHSPSMTTS